MLFNDTDTVFCIGASDNPKFKHQPGLLPARSPQFHGSRICLQPHCKLLRGC